MFTNIYRVSPNLFVLLSIQPWFCWNILKLNPVFSTTNNEVIHIFIPNGTNISTVGEDQDSASSVEGPWTSPFPWANSNAQVYIEKLPLRNNWGLNEQLLNNKLEKETEWWRLWGQGSPLGAVGAIPWWVPLFIFASIWRGLVGALLGAEWKRVGLWCTCKITSPYSQLQCQEPFPPNEGS